MTWKALAVGVVVVLGWCGDRSASVISVVSGEPYWAYIVSIPGNGKDKPFVYHAWGLEDACSRWEENKSRGAMVFLYSIFPKGQGLPHPQYIACHKKTVWEDNIVAASAEERKK